MTAEDRVRGDHFGTSPAEQCQKGEGVRQYVRPCIFNAPAAIIGQRVKSNRSCSDHATKTRSASARSDAAAADRMTSRNQEFH